MCGVDPKTVKRKVEAHRRAELTEAEAGEMPDQIGHALIVVA